MDACATSRAVSGSDEVHLALAEQLFDSIRHPSDVDGALPGAPADGGDRGARISTSDLARVIRACADTMEGETGVCIAVDDLGVPLAPCGAVPDDSQPDQKIGRAEFLEAMRKVQSIIGRRALGVGLRAQLRFVSAPSSAPCEWQQLSPAPPESRATSTTATGGGVPRASGAERGGPDAGVAAPGVRPRRFRRTSSATSSASSPARMLDGRISSCSSLGDGLGSPSSLSSSSGLGRKDRRGPGRAARSHEPGAELGGSSRFRRPSLMCDDWDELLLASEEVPGRPESRSAPSLTLPAHGASGGGGGLAGAGAAALSQAPEPAGGGAGAAQSASPPAPRRLVRRTSTLDSGLKLGGDKPLQRRGVVRSSTMDSGIACRAVSGLAVDSFRDALEKLKLSTFTTPLGMGSGRHAQSSKLRGTTQSEAHAAATEAEVGAATGSRAAWQLPQETLIILDWDDTLCPTSFIQDDLRLDWREVAPCFTTDPEMPLRPPTPPRQDSSDEERSRSPSPAPEEPPPAGPRMADALRAHVEVVTAFLRAAAARGVVVIVTLAKPGWVEVSTKNFLPGLQEVMDELKIEVLYARSMLAKWKFRSATLDHLDVLQLMKQVAMMKYIRKHYATRPCRSWKNLVCIGDSNTEHDAISEALFCWTQPEGAAPCRCKTLKLPEVPTVVELTSELEVLQGFLDRLALFDGDAHLDLTWAGSLLAGLESQLQEAAEAPSPVAAGEQDA